MLKNQVVRMRRKVCAVAAMVGVSLFAFGSRADAAPILIEFGETLAGNGPGGTWNRYGSVSSINGSTMVDATGTGTLVTFSYTGNLSVSTNAGPSLTYDNTLAVGNPSWAADSTNNNVAGDLFFTDNGSTGITGQTTFIFGGLTPGHTVSIDFLGARNSGSADGFYEYSIDGGTTYKGFTVLNPDGTPTTVGGWSGTDTKAKSFDNLADGYTEHRYMNVSDVELTGSTLRVRVTDISTANGNFAAMNAMRLTVVPEPTAMSLAAVGALATLAGRRRRGNSSK